MAGNTITRRHSLHLCNSTEANFGTSAATRVPCHRSNSNLFATCTFTGQCTFSHFASSTSYTTNRCSRNYSLRRCNSAANRSLSYHSA